MDIASERNFELRREAASGHIRMDLDASGDKASVQKDLSPKGLHHSAQRWTDSERAYAGLPKGKIPTLKGLHLGV